MSSRAALLAFALAPSVAGAATYDPDLTWRTITTEHFRIHFHQGEEKLADEFSAKVEAIYDTMVEEMKWRPRARTHVVLIDHTDVANGFAQSVPYNAITIFVTGPQEDSTLGLYEDWLTGIQTHEYTHTLHIDTNHGVARAARWVVGRISSTNRLSPGWMVEGMATFQETRHTRGGRGRTPQVEMIKAAAVLDDAIPPLGNLDGYQADLPGGNLRYLFGQDFMQYIADHHGRDVWTHWTHTYGSSVPYVLPGKPILGKSIIGLHKDWKEDLRRRVEARVARLEQDGPMTVGETVSDPTATCKAPSFSPDGEKLVWTCLDMRTGSSIWMSKGDGSEPEKILQDRGAKSFTWRGDSEAFVYAGLHVVNRFNTWSDIYMHTLGREKPSALTGGARARDPDFSPDGTRLLVVTNKAQQNKLVSMTVDKRRTVLAEHDDHTQYATPRYSPDGRAIAVSVWQDGRRDLWIYDADGTPRRRLTMDTAIEREPRWSADGSLLYFASDRSGVPNVYAIDVNTEELWQVTNSPTGAVGPSPHPDGTRLAWQEYRNTGWRVKVGTIDRTAWVSRGTLPRSLRYGTPIHELTTPIQGKPVAAADPAPTWPEATQAKRRGLGGGAPYDPFALSPLPDLAFPQSAGGLDSFDQSDVDDAHGDESDYPFRIEPKRYTPLGALLPRYWVPFVQQSPFPAKTLRFTRKFGVPSAVFSASTGSVDPLRHYAWSIAGNYRTDADFLSAGAGFTLNRWIPVYSVSLSRTAATPSAIYTPHPDNPVNDDGTTNWIASQRYWEKRTGGSLSVSYPYTFRTWVFARYGWSHRANLDPIPDDAYREALPLRGAIGTLQGGWRYSWNQQTRYAISTEDGRIFSLVGGLIHPYLGAYAETDDGRVGLSAAQLTAEVREYTVMPWSKNHVVAVRAGTGITLGSHRFLGLYQLGGSFGDSAFYVTPDSGLMLRGYPFGADVGDLYWLGSAEYRMPLHRIDRGLATYPVFLRALSAAAFVDAGNAFSEPSNVGDAFVQPLIGVGGELRISTVLWYGVGATGRFGFATGLTGPQAIRPTRDTPTGTSFDPRIFYARIGGSF